MAAMFFLPFMLLNFFSGIIGGIWLAVLGNWTVVLAGLALTFGGLFIVSLLLMPSVLLMVPLAGYEQISKSKFAMINFTILSLTYTYCVMSIWAIGIFWYFAHNSTTDAAIPTILWSYSTATAVWSYMAQKEGQAGNRYTVFSAFFYQISCIALMIYTYTNFRSPNPYDMFFWFAVPMGISLIVQIALVAFAPKAYWDRP